MSVIINELEVVSEAPAPSARGATGTAEQPQGPAARLTPLDVQLITSHLEERAARIRAH